MFKYASVVLLAAVAAPAFAQATPDQTTPATAEKAAYICWYNQAGSLTSAQIVPSGKVPRNFVITGRGGDKSWAYGLNSVDGKDCPVRVRK